MKRKLNNQEIKKIKDDGGLVIYESGTLHTHDMEKSHWVIEKSVRKNLGGRADRLERLSQIRENARECSDERKVGIAGRIIDNIINTSLQAHDKVYADGKVVEINSPSEKEYHSVGKINLITGEKTDDALRIETNDKLNGVDSLGNRAVMRVWDGKMALVGGIQRNMQIPWGRTMRERLPRDSYEKFLWEDLIDYYGAGENGNHLLKEEELREVREKVRNLLDESLATPYVDREPRALPTDKGLIERKIDNLVEFMRKSEYLHGFASKEDGNKAVRMLNNLALRNRESLEHAVKYSRTNGIKGLVKSFAAPFVGAATGAFATLVGESTGVIDSSQISEVGHYLPTILGVYTGVLFGITSMVRTEYWNRVSGAIQNRDKGLTR